MAKKFSTAILFELPCFTGGELGIRTPGSFWEHDISSLFNHYDFCGFFVSLSGCFVRPKP